MSEEIKSLKNYISTTKNEIFTTFKIETISNLIIYYEDLQQKVEQLEKENIKQKEIIENLTTMTVCGDKKQIKNTAQYKLEQLENIRKEAIEFMKENCDIITIDKGWIIRSELTTTGLGKLFKILNKGSESNV